MTAAAGASKPFRPGKALTLQVVAALATVVGLATWQVSRALEKMALEDTYHERLRAQPAQAMRYTETTPDFTRLALTGHYDPDHAFLVTSLGTPRGVTVVSVLTTQTGAFLVNRGWVSVSPPTAAPATPSEVVTVVGVAWPATPVSPRIRQETWTDDWPRTTRGMNVERMAEAAGTHPREVRLESGGEGVFKAASLAWDYSAGQHWSYAVQWLLIGTAVVIGYLLIGRRRGREAQADG